MENYALRGLLIGVIVYLLLILLSLKSDNGEYIPLAGGVLFIFSPVIIIGLVAGSFYGVKRKKVAENDKQKIE